MRVALCHQSDGIWFQLYEVDFHKEIQGVALSTTQNQDWEMS